MMTSSRVSRLGVGVVVFGVLLLTIAIPHGINAPSNVQSIFLSPKFWPTVIAFALVFLGTMLVVQQLVNRSLDNNDVNGDGSETDVAKVERGSPAGWMRLTLMASLMVGLIWAIPLFGLVWASMICFVAFAVIVRTPRRYTSLIVAILLPLFLYGFFNHVAGVAVPQGEFLRLP